MTMKLTQLARKLENDNKRLTQQIADMERDDRKKKAREEQAAYLHTTTTLKLRTDQEYALKMYMIKNGISDLSLGLQRYFDDVGNERYKKTHPRPTTTEKVTPGMCKLPPGYKP